VLHKGAHEDSPKGWTQRHQDWFKFENMFLFTHADPIKNKTIIKILKQKENINKKFKVDNKNIKEDNRISCLF